MKKHSGQPYFSIVIPTKNRSFFVGRALQSILDQTWQDWEVVVSDNDDSSDTAAVMEGYKDSRIRYVRTGGLNMPDNFESAYNHARGVYWLLLEDKSLLKPRALHTLAQLTTQKKPLVVSWMQDMFNDTQQPPTVLRALGSGASRWVTSDAILHMLQTEERGYYENFLPRGLNSCLHQDLAAQIKAGPFGRLCPPLSPDYMLAYQTLAFADRVLFVEDALTVFGSCVHSHGRKHQSIETLRRDMFADFGVVDENDIYSHVPLKTDLATGCLLNDYLRVREKLGGRLNRFPLDPVYLFVGAHKDLLRARAMGFAKTEEGLAWERDLALQPREVQRQVRRQIIRRKSPKDWARALVRVLGLYSAWLGFKRAFGWTPPQAPDNQILHFQTPVEYVRWETAQLSTVGA